jgi:methylenetetrahydrofolate dehydrogenase (NADP+)/methenyltetrahydrofolate cyclohydrolase
MTAKILDGRKVSQLLIAEVGKAVKASVAAGGRRPELAVVLVGENPASAIYVRNKRRACDVAGITSKNYNLPEHTTQAELQQLIEELNENPSVDGILVQLPLPAQIHEVAITNHISQYKDVDGFHAANVGSLALRQPGLRPCTPRGMMTLLSYYGISVKGVHVVIVGASNIVGRPMMLECLYKGATVTVTHRFTRDLESHVRRAEVLVVAVGKRGIVDSDWITRGAVVIDVGINRTAGGKVVGDVDVETASQRAGWISPVPGGVGPMTVATLLQNTAEAAGLDVSLP